MPLAIQDQQAEVERNKNILKIHSFKKQTKIAVCFPPFSIADEMKQAEPNQ